MTKTSISIQQVNDREYFETGEERQYRVNIAVKADTAEEAGQDLAEVLLRLKELVEGLNIMGCPDVAELEGGVHYEADTVYGYQFDFDSKKGFVAAVRKAMRQVKAERKSMGRLEALRKQLRSESISYSELLELQSLAEYIDKDDVELLEAAGVPEQSQ